MARRYEQYLLPDETVVWQWYENRTVLYWLSWFYLLCLWGLLYIIDFGFVAQEEWGLPMQSFTSSLEAILRIGGILLLVIIYWFLTHYLRRFVVTNKRVFIIWWIVGADIATLPFSQIKNVSVGVGLIGELLGIGNILIDTWKMHTRRAWKNTITETKYDILWYIDKPYEVMNHIQSQIV